MHLMVASELISPEIPSLRLHDTMQQALHWMQEHHVSALPLCSDDRFVGMVLEADLLDAPDERATLESIAAHVEKIAVKSHVFFLSALQHMQQRMLSTLAVTGEEDVYIGVITQFTMLDALAKYNAATEPGGVIVLQMRQIDFSISEIGRIVETNDARIIHMNTWTDDAGNLLVAIKVNKTDILDVLASFERYEYQVLQYFGENLSEDALKTNYDHLMNYLNI
jgi:acetoin utilization protein AcuB